MDGREAIEANVRLAIETLGPSSGIDFGLNRESVAWLEGFIERQRENFPEGSRDRLVATLASFLGECIVASTGGRWEYDEAGGWCVVLPIGHRCFPAVKVDKQFANGLEGGDSILGFYDVAVDFMATGRFDRARDEQQG